MPDRPTPLRAAGGVVWRERRGRLEVLLVHRPNRHDWSLPKGKPDPGENALETAVREVKEETGLDFALGPFLMQVSYPWLDSKKNVDYWSMRLDENSDGTPVAMDPDEIDGFQWLTLGEATDRLTYPNDVQVLEKFSQIGTVPITMLLVRHGSAGTRDEWSGPDDRRPLDPLGRQQADAIARTLAAFGPIEIYAARPIRCAQTIQPLAKRVGLKIKTLPEVSEKDFSKTPKNTVKSLTDLLGGPGPIVVCSQGGVIPIVIDELAPHRTGRKAKSRKGSTWALGVRSGRIETIDHYASLHKRT